MYRLINARPSPYGRKVAIAMHEKGLPFETLFDLPWADAVETRQIAVEDEFLTRTCLDPEEFSQRQKRVAATNRQVLDLGHRQPRQRRRRDTAQVDPQRRRLLQRKSPAAHGVFSCANNF